MLKLGKHMYIKSFCLVAVIKSNTGLILGKL